MSFHTGLGAVLGGLTLAHTERFLWGKQKKRHYYGISGFLYLVGAFIFLNRLLRTVLAWSFPLTSFEGQVSLSSWVTSRWPVWTLLLGNETLSRCHLSICISSQSPLQALEFCFWRCVIEVFNPKMNRLRSLDGAPVFHNDPSLQTQKGKS